MNDNGDIDALELATGKLLWQTPKGTTYFPLLTVGQWLVVRVREKDGQVKIATLDTTAKGNELLRSQALSFPFWVRLYRWFEDVQPGRGLQGPPASHDDHTFVAVERVDNGQLLVEWKAHFRRISYKGEELQTRQGKGTCRVNLKTGEATSQSAEEKVTIDQESQDRINAVETGGIELSSKRSSRPRPRGTAAHVSAGSATRPPSPCSWTGTQRW